MFERRSKLRANTAVQGRAAFDEGVTEIAYTVLNFSPSGACLAFPGDMAVPQRFGLSLGQEPAPSAVRVVWRQHVHVGVVFVTPRAVPDVIAG